MKNCKDVSLEDSDTQTGVLHCRLILALLIRDILYVQIKYIWVVFSFWRRYLLHQALISNVVSHQAKSAGSYPITADRQTWTF